MTVQQLIDALMEEPNKEKEVCVYVSDGHLMFPDMVDHTISDRLDLNCSCY